MATAVADDLAAALTAGLRGRYTLLRELGRGGMATVFLAQDLRHDRNVALKVLHPDLADAIGSLRFQREIRLAARLQHPHIIPVFDSGEAGGALYYVMPHVRGESLRELLSREGRLPWPTVASIARETADALDYAHREGILHRDIKPENVLLAGGHAFLGDFGIARPIVAPAEGPLTSASMIFGTPAYMSPEQAAGEEKLDGRTDQYSLACVVYEMVVGAMPFDGDSAGAIIAQRFTTAPAPARSRGAAVGEGADAALLRALSVESGARFATVGAFVDALTSGGAPVVAAPQEGPSLAVLPFANVSPDPDSDYFSDGITEELINALAKVPGLRVASRTSVFALRQERADVRQIGGRLGVGFVVEGSVRKAGTRLRITAELVGVRDGYQLWAESYDRQMADVFAIQEDIAGRIADSLKLRLLGRAAREVSGAATPRFEAYHLYLRGRYHWNNRPVGLRKALEYFEQACAVDPGYALAHAGVADCYATLGSWESGALRPSEAFPRAAREARRALELDPALGEAHTALAYIALHHEWDQALVELEFQSALALSPLYTTAHHWRSHYLMASGRIAESLNSSRRCLELDPLDQLLNTHLAWHHLFAREYDEAIAQCGRTEELYPASFWTPYFGGVALGLQGRFSEAAAELARAEERSGGVTFARAARGYVLGLSGERREAEEILAGLATQARTGYVPAYDRALVHIGLGQTDRAFEELDLALEERSSWMAYLGVEPRLDPLRADPRFARLVGRVAISAARPSGGPQPSVP